MKIIFFSRTLGVPENKSNITVTRLRIQNFNSFKETVTTIKSCILLNSFKKKKQDMLAVNFTHPASLKKRQELQNEFYTPRFI